ncbi:MAG: hypothetical protein A2015_07615 [Spirochaetes bacterium GWF1_31_7]|nr:MAG: hypothetical protein A2Y30_01710 [Spirochaetes bacterium GWE1_32_154]OHD46910.1 MAG: hypothetical protein A2015_07615 [Spirochaetes bacterium GWF1_31_7]HBD94915.1 hypothetical protein [Spirochaetia bacterium]HBI36904.1 hypothetical protein [Spirochaetia bacterium]
MSLFLFSCATQVDSSSEKVAEKDEIIEIPEGKILIRERIKKVSFNPGMLSSIRKTRSLLDSDIIDQLVNNCFNNESLTDEDTDNKKLVAKSMIELFNKMETNEQNSIIEQILPIEEMIFDVVINEMIDETSDISKEHKDYLILEGELLDEIENSFGNTIVEIDEFENPEKSTRSNISSLIKYRVVTAKPRSSNSNMIYAYNLANYFVETDLFDELSILSKEASIKLNTSKIKKISQKLKQLNDDISISTRSPGSELFTKEYLKNTLKHGDILLVKWGDSNLTGYFTHGGVLDYERFRGNGDFNPRNYCVLSAIYVKAKHEKEEEKLSDRENFVGYDRLSLYNRNSVFKAIRPKDNSKAASVMTNLHNEWYTTWTPYALPVGEYLYVPFGLTWNTAVNSSHNFLKDWVYCTKLIWTGWKKWGGVDVEGYPRNRGGLISPDNIANSCNNYTYQKVVRVQNAWSPCTGFNQVEVKENVTIQATTNFIFEKKQ